MPPVRDPSDGKVTVRWAVNGTLPNGSDLQPLAVPADLRLEIAQQRALSAFTHAAWSACDAREARYFAFFPLDDDRALWALSRVTRLERGAFGWVLVVWSALISREVLDGLSWRVDRLLPTAFPAPHVPVRGETYPPVQVDLAPRALSAANALGPAVDTLKAGLAGRPIGLALRPAPPLTAEAAIFALWSRLGTRRKGLSFCTWSGVESAAFPPPERPFNVVVADGEAPVQPRPGRVERSLTAAPAARPSLAVEVLSFLDGVDIPPRDAPSAHPKADAAEVAEALFAVHGEDLAREPQATFARLADDIATLDRTFAPARLGLYDLLARAAAAVAGGQARAGLIADFQAGARAVVAGDAAAPGRIAAVAVEAQAVAFFSADQWASLGPSLLQAPGRALAPPVIEALATAPAARVAWGAILAIAPDGPASAPLLRLAAARAWGQPAGQAAFERLLALGPAQASAFVEDPGLAPDVRRQALAALCRARKRPIRDMPGLVAYQRYCLWLRDRARAAPAVG